MNTVFIVPTGIGCSIGGHAGDATPYFKLIASVSDIAITHPNVVNASDINEMPENSWYVEGSMLDRFLEGKINLFKPFSNRILLLVNKPLRPETVNAVNAAQNTIGCQIEIVELNTKLDMIATIENNKASGEIKGFNELFYQIQDYNFDALAIASQITVDKNTALNYFRNGGINPWGGVEAKLSKLIAIKINKPVAHAPVETDDKEIKMLNEIVDPRMAAEMISQCYIHCVFKGLHKAPNIVYDGGVSNKDIGCLITPLNCYGEPHKACIKNNIPIIAVEENKTCLNVETPYTYLAKNYLEVVGYIQKIKAGVNI